MKTLPALLLVFLLPVLTACDRGRTPEERLYRDYCAKCHGLDGSGNTPAYMGEQYADLTDDIWRAGGSEYAIRGVIRGGVFGKMPGYPQLTDQEVDLLVKYLRTLRPPGSSR
jgi:mono/diheme cytochrome c family protein